MYLVPGTSTVYFLRRYTNKEYYLRLHSQNFWYRYQVPGYIPWRDEREVNTIGTEVLSVERSKSTLPPIDTKPQEKKARRKEFGKHGQGSPSAVPEGLHPVSLP
jgi:hypothetical protein